MPEKPELCVPLSSSVNVMVGVAVIMRAPFVGEVIAAVGLTCSLTYSFRLLPSVEDAEEVYQDVLSVAASATGK